MILFYIALIVLVFVGAHRRPAASVWCSKESAAAIKGFFMLTVFLAHAFDYTLKGGLAECSFLDRAGFTVRSGLGQLIVVMFLFFSGYGVALSFKSKGFDYLKRYPKTRLVYTILNFDVAVMMFFVVTMVLGGEVSLVKLIKSLLAWDSMGNSNWYIFTIIICYLAHYLLMRLQVKRWFFMIGAYFIITQIMAQVRPNWWYNTMLAYPLGAIFADKKDYAAKVLDKHYWLTMTILLFCFFVPYIFRYDYNGIAHNVMGCLFSLLVVVVMYRYEISGHFLTWVGGNIFPIYIYQRLPMLLLSVVLGKSFCHEHSLFFVTISAAIVCAIVFLYPKFKIGGKYL